jgi:replicative DNA helicase
MNSETNIPPQAVEAEESIIAAILLDNQVLMDVFDILTPDDFYRSSHRKIMTAIQRMSAKNDPIDIVTLTNTLRDKNQLDEIGGATYLARLLDTVPAAIKISHYAKIIHDKSLLRQMIAKCNETARKCFEGSEEPAVLLDKAQASMMSIDVKSKTGSVECCEIIEECVDRLEELQKKKGFITGVPSGFNDLDLLTGGWQDSDLILLAARPASGKSTLAINWARNAAMEGIPTCVWELEMNRHQLGNKLISSTGKVNGNKFRHGGRMSKDDWGRVTNACGKLADIPLYINDDPNLTHMSMWQDMRRMKQKHNIGLAIIDYLQLMKRGTANIDAIVSEISRSFKLAAKELCIPVILLSQLNRKLEERSDKHPQLSDLRDSGSLEQDADIVVFIYRDELYNTDPNNPNIGIAELSIKKNRLGQLGTVKTVFFGHHSVFKPLARE